MAKEARIDVRLSPQDDHLIRRAAESVGSTVTRFVVSSAAAEAHHVLAERTLFALDEESWVAFVERLDSPPVVKPRLARLAGEPDVFE